MGGGKDKEKQKLISHVVKFALFVFIPVNRLAVAKYYVTHEFRKYPNKCAKSVRKLIPIHKNTKTTPNKVMKI